jgi:hypothetical protein
MDVTTTVIYRYLREQDDNDSSDAVHSVIATVIMILLLLLFMLLVCAAHYVINQFWYVTMCLLATLLDRRCIVLLSVATGLLRWFIRDESIFELNDEHRKIFVSTRSSFANVVVRLPIVATGQSQCNSRLRTSVTPSTPHANR